MLSCRPQHPPNHGVPSAAGGGSGCYRTCVYVPASQSAFSLPACCHHALTARQQQHRQDAQVWPHLGASRRVHLGKQAKAGFLPAPYVASQVSHPSHQRDFDGKGRSRNRMNLRGSGPQREQVYPNPNPSPHVLYGVVLCCVCGLANVLWMNGWMDNPMRGNGWMDPLGNLFWTPHKRAISCGLADSSLIVYHHQYRYCLHVAQQQFPFPTPQAAAVATHTSRPRR